jgi:hypothetical protein
VRRFIHTISFYTIVYMSCSGTRNLPEGELLYRGAKIKWKGKQRKKKERKALKAEFEAIVRPKLIVLSRF